MEPLVTVLLPVYNGDKYLRETMDSILAQTYTHFEFLIIDDGSTDNSAAIIASYADERIRYVKNEKNLRIVQTLNKGISLANGKYIARIDGDDIAFPNRLAEQVAYLEAHPDVAVVAAVMELFDGEGNSLDKIDAPTVSPEQLHNSLPKHNYISHPSVMARTELMKKYLYRQIWYEDYDLWLRMANDGLHLAKIDHPLGKYRIHTGSIMGAAKTNKDNFRKVAVTKRYYLAHLAGIDWLKPFNRKVSAYMVKDYLLYLYKSGKSKLGR